MQLLTFTLSKYSTRYFSLLLTVLLLHGCAAAAVGTVAAVDIASDRRTLGKYVDDNTVELKIRQAIRGDTTLKGKVNISVTSMNGVVLLSGEAPNTALRDRALAYARGFAEVRQVVNEIRLAGKTSWPSRMNDSWITTKVKTRLYKETRIDANRVKVVTEQGNVYLMGLVTRTEGDSAAGVARTVKGVTRVVKVFEYIQG
ncbi:MAG: division/outer membrane stress-associated lipid-binding lipoprotein [Gammaproteobacteria bacterium]|nr:division/outer membrane stress-associated lipid-binding lipoprotein [Gammaproteobacteria bacterium]